MNPEARGVWGPRIAAVALLALGGVVLYETFQITRGGGYSAVGPAAVPLGVSVGLIALSALFLARTTVVPDTDLVERAGGEEALTDWPTVGLVTATLVAYVFALGLLGYIVATAAFLPITAWVLGSRHVVRDVLIGAALATVIYFGFTELLGLRLPAGVLDAVL